MHSEDAATRSRRGWRLLSLKALLTVIVVPGLLLLIAFHFRTHLLWRFGPASAHCSDVGPVPVAAIPDAKTPDDWVHCRFGSLEFDLPAELAENVQQVPNQVPALLFKHKSTSVVAYLPLDGTHSIKELETTLLVPPQGRGLSLSRLRVACYQASWDDFRWTMSASEVSWHAWCVSMSSILRFGHGGHVDTLFRDDLEGTVHYSTTHACFDWQATDRSAQAYWHFSEKSGQLDPSWVRCICQSTEFHGEFYPEKIPGEEVMSLFKVTER